MPLLKSLIHPSHSRNAFSRLAIAISFERALRPNRISPTKLAVGRLQLFLLPATRNSQLARKVGFSDRPTDRLSVCPRPSSVRPSVLPHVQRLLVPTLLQPGPSLKGNLLKGSAVGRVYLPTAFLLASPPICFDVVGCVLFSTLSSARA